MYLITDETVIKIKRTNGPNLDTVATITIDKDSATIVYAPELPSFLATKLSESITQVLEALKCRTVI